MARKAKRSRRGLGASEAAHTESTGRHERAAFTMIGTAQRYLNEDKCVASVRSLIVANGHIQAAQEAHISGRGGGTERVTPEIHRLGNAYYDVRDKIMKSCVRPNKAGSLSGTRRKARR